MSSEDTLELARSFANVMAAQMQGSMADALVASESRCYGLAHEKYPHLRPQFARCDLREHLSDTGLPPGWSLGGNPRRSGQLHLVSDGMVVRVLKERRKHYPGGVPPAGHNRSRRAYWQGSLDVGDMDGALIKVTNFLFLWDYLDCAGDELAFTTRLVHPTAPGKYGRQVPLDVSLDLTGWGQEELILPADFEVDPLDDEDFYAEIDREENDEGSEWGSAR